MAFSLGMPLLLMVGIGGVVLAPLTAVVSAASLAPMMPLALITASI